MEEIDLKWDTGSAFLTGKTAKHGEKVTVSSNVRLVASKFNKDAEGNPKMDKMVDLKMSDGTIKVFRLNLASQKNFEKAKISPKECSGTDCTVHVVSVLVRGELAKSVVLNPLINEI